MPWPTGIRFHMTRASTSRGQKHATIRFVSFDDARHLLDGDMFWPTHHRIVARLQAESMSGPLTNDTQRRPSGRGIFRDCSFPCSGYGGSLNPSPRVNHIPPPPIGWWQRTELISNILAHLRSHQPDLDPVNPHPAYTSEEMIDYWDNTEERLSALSSLHLFRLERACRPSDIRSFHIEDAFIKSVEGATCNCCGERSRNIVPIRCTPAEDAIDTTDTSYNYRDPCLQPTPAKDVTVFLPRVVYSL